MTPAWSAQAPRPQCRCTMSAYYPPQEGKSADYISMGVIQRTNACLHAPRARDTPSPLAQPQWHVCLQCEPSICGTKARQLDRCSHHVEGVPRSKRPARTGCARRGRWRGKLRGSLGDLSSLRACGGSMRSRPHRSTEEERCRRGRWRRPRRGCPGANDLRERVARVEGGGGASCGARSGTSLAVCVGVGTGNARGGRSVPHLPVCEI